MTRSTQAPVISHRDLMLATPARAPFSRKGWLFELKYDGFRTLAIKDRSGARLLTRRGIDLSRAFPELIVRLERLPDVVIDGELVMLDEAGYPRFERLLGRVSMRRRLVKRVGTGGTAAIIAFDLLSLAGEDLRPLPLIERKDRLREVLRGSERIHWLGHIRTEGAAFYAAVENAGLKGIVAKREDAPYRSGRSQAWLKVKTPAFKAIEANRLEHRLK
jgi:bifunctional non-homologous end joining protein LigD